MNVNNYKCGPRGIALIKEWEKCVLIAYQDEKGVWTIGWGHTGADVSRGTRWSQSEADATFGRDIGWAEDAVNRLVTVGLSQQQFDALVSFVFNVGARNFKLSTLLTKINGGDFGACPAQFRRWGKITDPTTNRQRVSNGLVRRRSAEIYLFNAIVY